MAVELHLWMVPVLWTFGVIVVMCLPAGSGGGTLGSALGNAVAGLFAGLVLIIGTLLVWLVWAFIAIIWRIY